MKCQLIQTTKLDDSNKAEREMLTFLGNLPAKYFVYRELKITPAYEDRVFGMEQKQPDFVVVAADVGIVSIEVKDWNLDKNTYEWKDQIKIKKISCDGKVEELGNPVNQANIYRYALIELLSGIKVYVTSVLAFPRITKQEILNKLSNIQLLQNPQSRFFLDLDKTIFKEDLDENFLKPERVLTRIVRHGNIQHRSRFFPSTARDVYKVNQRILPNSFRIGDFTKRQANRKQLKVITEEQQKWIFGLERKANYLLDVAGSGKTNALISKAIYLVDETLNKHHNPPHILLTTYNDNLAKNIKRIFLHKLPNSKEQYKYQEAIKIWSVPTLMKQIVENYYKVRTTEEAEDTLRQEVEEILRADPNKYRHFDYLFIDEIQDFDNFYLLVAKHLCKSDNFFFIGDIGQKIYERSCDLERLGLLTRKIELNKSYKMFRTPRYIAELATRFILGDVWTRKEFEAHGYREDFQYPNQLLNAAEMLKSNTPEMDVTERIQTLLSSIYIEEDMMVITSKAKMDQFSTAFTKADINFHIGETESGGTLTLVDFMNVKGLEKEVVFVSGIEDLYDRAKSGGIFDDEDIKAQRERLSRRKIYVSLTRSLEELLIYYNDSHNRFVSELLNINRRILKKRVKGS